MRSILRLALLSLAIGLPAQSVQAQDIERGPLLICDTQKQVERLGEVYAGKSPEALLTVNSEENKPNACVAANVAFVPGKVLGTVRSKTHTFHVVPIIVLGVRTQAGMQPVNAAVFFTIRVVKVHSI